MKLEFKQYSLPEMLPVQIHDDALLRDVGLELDVDAVAVGGNDVTVVALRP